MPFLEGFSSDNEEDFRVQSDLLNSVEAEQGNLAAGPGSHTGPSGSTVVHIDDQVGEEGDMSPGPVADMGDDAPPSAARRRGRPTSSASATPAKTPTAGTPRSSKGAAVVPKSSGRKRKAAEVESEAEPEPTPAAKRGRPARTTGVAASARLAAKSAKKSTRGRPKASAAASAAPEAKGRAGIPKKDAADQYEVEDIVDSKIDAETFQHMYLVKWKGYSASENTWEPKVNLAGSQELLRKFDAKKKKAAPEKPSALAATGKKALGRPGRKAKAKA